MATFEIWEKPYHIKATEKQVGKYVILTGDPDRVPKIAEKLDNAELITKGREFVLYTGELLSQPVSVCSTGIGGPSAAIAVEELVKCGADTFIRVGTCGGIDFDMTGGDLCIASAAIRCEGTSQEYLPDGYPAVADFRVTLALIKAADKLCSGQFGDNFQVGVVQSKDSFYGEMEPEKSPVSQKLLENWESYVECGCKATEMECAAIFSVGISKKVRCGAVLNVLWNIERRKAEIEDIVNYDTEKGIICAVEGIRNLIVEDTFGVPLFSNS
ncbi:MAG: nucleoside phosphorylase [Ruminococcus sp.]|nr:nucleoside phosphorylase [Ruminococcus sp.]